jgi:hypothetical protein
MFCAVIGIISLIAKDGSLFTKLTGIMSLAILFSSTKVVTGSARDLKAAEESSEKKLERLKSSREYFLVGLPVFVVFIIALLVG